MDRDTLTAALRDLPDEVAKAEAWMVELEITRRRAEELLKDKEAAILLSGIVDGKNEAVRAAQLRELTAERRQTLARLEEDLAEQRVEWHRELNRFSAAKALARLLATTTEAL